MSKEHWIQGALQHRGALHKEMGVPEDQVIPEDKLREAAGKPGTLGARARLAMTLKGMHHSKEHRSTEDLKKAYEEHTKK